MTDAMGNSESDKLIGTASVYVGRNVGRGKEGSQGRGKVGMEVEKLNGVIKISLVKPVTFGQNLRGGS